MTQCLVITRNFRQCHFLDHRIIQFSSVQSLGRVWLFATPWIAALQASLSTTNSWSSLRLKSIESVMPSSHLILWRPLLLLPPIPLSIRVFSSESTLRMRWPKYWSFSFSIIPSYYYYIIHYIIKWEITEYFVIFMCALSHFSLLTLWEPMDCSPPDYSVHGILQATILEWIVIPSSKGSSWPRDWTCVSYVSCIGREVLYY